VHQDACQKDNKPLPSSSSAVYERCTELSSRQEEIIFMKKNISFHEDKYFFS